MWLRPCSCRLAEILRERGQGLPASRTDGVHETHRWGETVTIVFQVFAFISFYFFICFRLASYVSHLPGDQLEWTPSQHLVEEMFDPDYKLPDEVYRRFPSHVQIYTLVRARGQGNETRMLNAVLQFLSERKSDGVHVDVPSTNIRSIEQYERMGFRHVPVHKGQLGCRTAMRLFWTIKVSARGAR